MMRNRKVWGVLGLLLALVVTVGYGQQPLQPTQFQEFWDLFQKHKDRCPKEGELRDFWYTLLSVGGDSYAVFWDKDPDVPAGGFDDAHTFGWFYGDIGGRALQPVLLGSYTRGIMGGLPHPSIPTYQGFRNQSGPQPVHIYSPDTKRPLGAIGYFVNFAYHPGGQYRHIGGLYYTDKALNKDGKIHFKLLQIPVDPPRSYFILCWEDLYNYTPGPKEPDFNDLFIGLFHYLRP